MNSFCQKDPGGTRYAISRRDGRPFGVAGIWENWRDPLTGKWEGTFAVVTVPANELVTGTMIACSRYRQTIGLRAG
jgi:putative SOS response-associated peptidase YedK